MSLQRRTGLVATILIALAIQPHEALADQVSNSISGLEVKPNGDDWVLEFDYVFTGEPATAAFQVVAVPEPGTDPTRFWDGPSGLLVRPEQGAHHVRAPFAYPGDGTSKQVIVSLIAKSPGGKELASQRIDKVIKWPAQYVRKPTPDEKKPTEDEQNFATAVGMVETGQPEALRQARGMLERLLGKNPKLDQAYVELARIAMKTNWGAEGLHQAETLLDSAMKIRPESVNAKILLGYVYAHQHRFQEAEALFVAANRADPSNIWLWDNWGELLEMEGKPDQAIVKYREAIARSAGSSFGNVRARASAYGHLLPLLEKRKDLDGLEAMYKQRLGEYGPGSCFSADYARFKLTVRGDAQGAIDLARGALNLNCDDAPSREILGLASYVQWAQATGVPSAEALNQARIFLPTGPRALYLLARSETTLPAAKKLIGSGEAIDQKDNERMTALALALQMDDLEAAQRLLRLGARPDAPVGMQEMPVALLPVLETNLDAVRIMQRAGVDYSKLRYRGATALDFAKQMDDDALLKALTHKERAL